ncbi:MAG: arginase family protein [Weeksellaceae bacterium]|nr:arginase family protein [Weeksellaceae bacterium]
MDIEEFLVPVAYSLTEDLSMGHRWSIGANCHFGIPSNPEPDAVFLVFVANEQEFDQQETAFEKLRRNFYSLSHSNWSLPLYDLGTIVAKEDPEYLKFAAFSVAREIQKYEGKLIVVGGAHSLTYQLYLALQGSMKSVCTVDYRIDLNIDSPVDEERFISDMILNSDHPLLDYVNLGSQAPFRYKEESDILEQMNFEEIRLGRLIDDITLAEPYIREVDIFSVDVKALQQSSFPDSDHSSPNGLNAREICQIMKYAGNSWQLTQTHIAGVKDFSHPVAEQLTSEMLWYYLEAMNNRQQDGELQVYHVQFDDEEIVFYKSVRSGKWWVETIVDGMQKKIPCSHMDYHKSLQGELPDRWLKFFKKFY